MKYRSVRWLAISCGALALACNAPPTLIGSPDAGLPDSGPTADAADACHDGVRNGDEPQVDCGGDCDPCADGASCIRPSDCQSGVCNRGFCLQRSCNDGVRNGPESGVDCGGDCGLCPDGESCSSSDQCESGHCQSSMCVPSVCDDGRRNGGETDRDCGGRECAPCAAGAACAIDGDCETLRCVEGSCAAPTCADRIQNQDETSLDCGGAVCAPCADGFACEFDLDCASQRCYMGGCVSCTDGIRNATETDVDCGGDTCGGCHDGLACSADADCASHRCLDGACISCSDGTQNADETDVDCGGSVCGDCGTGAMCLSDGDCLSAACSDGVCVGVADACTRPAVLAPGANTVGWVASNNDYLTTHPECLSTANDVVGPDVVMSYTATVDGFLHYTIAKPNSTRWVLEVSSEPCGTIGTGALCQSEFSGTELVGQFPITTGTTYYFYIIDTDSGTNPLSNPLEVTIDEIVPPCTPGVGGVVGTSVTRLPTTISTVSEYYVVPDSDPAGYVYIGGISYLYRVPKAGGTAEDIEDIAGLTSSDMGYTLVVSGNEVYSIDDSTTSASNRIVRLTVDGGATWISGGENYASFASTPNDDFRGAVVYGGVMYLVTQDLSEDTEIWSVPTGAATTTTPVAATLVGTIPYFYCTGLAADAQYLYTMCEDTDELVRIDRTTLATTAFSVASLSLTKNSIVSDDNDGDGLADALYYNLATEDAYYACGLDTASPFTGSLTTWGGATSSYGLGFDAATNTLYGYDDDSDELIVIH